MVLGNAEAIVMAVSEGIGAAFVSRLSAAQALALGLVVEVQVAGMTLKRTLYFVRNRNHAFTRCQSEFWQFMQRSLEAPGSAADSLKDAAGQTQDKA
jgi:DNA-binding transcriptional LysR family regulator